MIVSDGSAFADSKIKKFHEEYPFGEWEIVAETAGIPVDAQKLLAGQVAVY